MRGRFAQRYFPGFFLVLNDSGGVVHNSAMNDPQSNDLRRRIRELNAIPERDRTDEQWDELNELEIRTAPGNRLSASDRQSDNPQEKRQRSGGQGRRPDRNQGPRNNNGPRPEGRSPDSRPQEARADRPPKQRQHRRPKRPADSAGGGGGNPSGGGNGGGNGGTNSGNSGGGGTPPVASSGD